MDFGKSPQGVQISNRVYSRKSGTITDLKEAISEEMRVIRRSVCKTVMDIDNFVLRLKKCMELNSGHLEHMLWSIQEQAERQYDLTLYLEYNKMCLNFNLI